MQSQTETTPADLNPRPPEAVLRSFEDLRTTGLLWLINSAVFHPRGFALAFVYGQDGDVRGWRLLGNGTEPWVFMPGHEFDVLFSKVEELFKEARDGQS